MITDLVGRKSVVRSLGVLVLALVATGCSADDADYAEDASLGESVEATTTVMGGSLQVDLPDGIALETTAIAATGQLSVNDRANVLGTVGGLGVAVNVGTGQTTVGTDARIGDVLGGGNVSVRDRAFVARNVQAEGTFTRGSNVIVNGTIAQRAPLKPKVNRSWLVGFSDTAANVTLNSGQSQTHLPGTFGNVTVNAGGKLTLKAGTYNINSLKLEPQSTLKLDTSGGPIFVNVKNELVFRGTVESRSTVASKALFTYLGSTLVSLDAPFAGTLIAPNATIKAESLNGATHYGAFFGRDVELHQGGKLQHVPFVSFSSLPFINDGADAIAAVPASTTFVRDGADGVLTYAPNAPLLLDFSGITVRRVTTLPDGPVLDFGNNLKCAQRLGLLGLDCNNDSPQTFRTLSNVLIRRPLSRELIAALTSNLRRILYCGDPELCFFSAGGLFRLSSSYPAVKRQLKWQTVGVGYDNTSDSLKAAYDTWSDDPSVIPNKRELHLAINDAASWLARSDRFTNFRGQPETALTESGDGRESEDDDTAGPRYFISYEEGWRLYLWWVSHNIALDRRRELPWTLDDIAAIDESMLAPLFDSVEMMNRRPAGDVALGFGPHGNFHDLPWSTYRGQNIIGTPRFTYRFLAQNGLIGDTRLDSIEALIDWSANLTHFYGSATRENAEAHWGHRYFPTVEQVVNGTIREGESTPQHWTMGCHGTSAFMKDVLRAINIPVRIPFICGHAEVQFLSEGKFLDHADNPYNSNYTQSACGPDHLLLDTETFVERFGRSVNHDDAETCAGDGPVAMQVRDESVATCE
jgi:hypothetical protein